MTRRDEKLNYLSSVYLFSGCSKKDLQLIAKYSEHITVPAGTELTTEGKTGNEFFLILDGKAAVERKGTRVNTLGPGAFFGELALLDGARRNATVRAETELDVILLGQREFSGLLEAVPTLAHRMLIGLARRVHEMDAASIN